MPHTSPRSQSAALAHLRVDFALLRRVGQQVVIKPDSSALEERGDTGPAETEIAFLLPLGHRTPLVARMHGAHAGRPDCHHHHFAEDR